MKNNQEKFPERFTFKLTDEETSLFLVKNFDQKKETRGGGYKDPRAFTKQDVYTLTSCLKTEIIKKVSVTIIIIFVIYFILFSYY